MSAAISEIDLYTALRDKLGDSETRDLIEYVKSSREIVTEAVKADRSVLATKEGLKSEIASIKNEIALSRAATREDIASLKTEIERGLKEQLKWLIVLLMGFSSLIITVIKLM